MIKKHENTNKLVTNIIIPIFVTISSAVHPKWSWQIGVATLKTTSIFWNHQKILGFLRIVNLRHLLWFYLRGYTTYVSITTKFQKKMKNMMIQVQAANWSGFKMASGFLSGLLSVKISITWKEKYCMKTIRLFDYRYNTLVERIYLPAAFWSKYSTSFWATLNS